MGDNQEDPFSLVPLGSTSDGASSSKDNMTPLARSRSASSGPKRGSSLKKQPVTASASLSSAGSLIPPSLTAHEKKKLKKMKKKVSEKDSTIINLQQRIQDLETERESMLKELQQRGISPPNPPVPYSQSSENAQAKTYCFDLPNTALNIRYSEESGSEKILEAATIEKLLEKLTLDAFKPPALQKTMSIKKAKIGDAGKMSGINMPLTHLLSKEFTLGEDIVDEFLHTYTEVTNAHTLVDLLFLRYNGPNPSQDNIVFAENRQMIRHRVLFFFKRWCTVRPYDFERDDQLSAKVESFFQTLLAKKSSLDQAEEDLPDVTLTNEIQEILVLLKETGESVKHDTFLHLSQIVPEEFAQQLTLLEYKLMREVKSREFLKQRWNKDHKETEAPNLIKAIDWFNKMSSWFSTEVVKEETAEGRKTVIVNLIKVAMKCHTLKNYKAIMEILASLHSHSISCLKHTWELVPSKMIEELDKLGKILSPKGNYKHYRALLNTEQPPFVPYVGLFLTDLTFLDDCKPDFIEGLINVDKVRAMGKKIKEYHRFHTALYDIPPNPTLQNQILNGLQSKLFDSNDIYRICKLREQLTEEPVQGTGLNRKRAKKAGATKYATYFNTLELTGQEQVNANHTELTESDWANLLKGAITISKKKDEPIIKEGEQNQHIYIIKAGRTRVEVFGDDGTPRVVAFMEEDAIFGEMSLFNKSNKATARVVADDEVVELLQISVAFIYQLLDDAPDLAKRFYGAMAMIFARRLRDRTAAPSQPRIEKSGSAIGSSIRTVVEKGNSSSRKSAESPTDAQTRARSGTLSKRGTSFPLEAPIKDWNCVVKQKALDRRGILTLTQSTLSFVSKTFTFETKYFFLFSSISAIAKKAPTQILIAFESKQYVFDLKGERDSAFDLIQSFWKQSSQAEQKLPEVELEPKKFGGPVDFQFEDPLTQDDWNLMLKGAKTVPFQKGETVIKQGQLFQRLYHVASGTCVVDKDGKPVGKIRAGEIFGEISFLDSHGATVSVLADQEEGAELYIIEGYFIRILFNLRPGFAGRFFHYICCLLASRLSR